MSTTDIAPETVADVPAGAAADDASGGTLAALATWLTSSDSKVIGRNFIGCSLLALVGAAVLGVMLGAERIDGGDTLFDDGALPQMFVAFRIALVFGVLVPLLLGIAVAAVPLQVGARSLAFPRLAAAGFWAWFSGLVLVMVALANNGGPGGGNEDMVDLFIAALGLLVIGLAAAALPVAATVLTTRAPGMRMGRVPFFAWSALVASIGFLLVLPVLLGVLIFLFVDHRYARALFGGNSGVGEWVGFALTQPVTYLFALPAVGIVAELLPLTFRKRMPLRAAVYGGLALIGVAALSGVTQQVNHDLPWAGGGADLDGIGDKVSDLVPYALFTLLPLLGLVIVMLVGAIAARPPGNLETWVRPKFTPAFVFAFFGVGMIFVGMLGGALVPITDLGLQGTVFEEGVVVYVVYGAVLAGLGGLAWWRPEVVGPGAPERACQRPRPARCGGDDPRLAAVLRRRVRRPAGGVGRLRLRRPGRGVERPRHRRAHPDARRRAGVPRPLVAPEGRRRRARRRRPVGRPDPRVADDVARAARQLHRGAHGDVAGAGVRPARRAGKQALMQALPAAPAPARDGRSSSARHSPASPRRCSWAGCSPSGCSSASARSTPPARGSRRASRSPRSRRT